MKKILLIVIATSILIAPLNAMAAVKAGDSCKKVGLTATSGGKKYTCIKSGKRLVWNKGVAIAKPVPTVSPTPVPTAAPIPTASPVPTEEPKKLTYPFPNKYWMKEGDSCTNEVKRVVGYKKNYDVTFLFCDQRKVWYVNPNDNAVWDQETGMFEEYGGMYLNQYEPDVPSEWRDNLFNQLNNGLPSQRPPYAYFSGDSNLSSPGTKLESNPSVVSIENCKLKGSDIPTRWGDWTNSGFPLPEIRWRVTNVNIQLMPLAFPDRQSKVTPEQLFGPVMRAVTKYWENTSDVEVKINWRVPNNWIQLSKPIQSYMESSNGKDPLSWGRNTVKEADPQVNFTGANMIIFVTPVRNSLNDWQPMHFHSPLIPSQGWKTDEGTIHNVSLMEWFTSGENDTALAPMGWIHHFLHMSGADDNFDLRNPVNPVNSRAWVYEVNRYMGVWGNMSKVQLNEPLFWDKFRMGQINDSQVYCVSPSTAGTYWLRPNAIKGNFVKGLVIPLGSQKGIVIESVRAIGYNYLMYPKNQGALIYTVDTSSSDWENHPLSIVPRSGVKDKLLSDAPLREGDSVVVNGVRITVIEAGDFGDVVKVEKA
jgi:hypothetical protein